MVCSTTLPKKIWRTENEVVLFCFVCSFLCLLGWLVGCYSCCFPGLLRARVVLRVVVLFVDICSVLLLGWGSHQVTSDTFCANLDSKLVTAGRPMWMFGCP